MLIDDVKLSLRIKNIAYDEEIQNLINAAEFDLINLGIKIDETNPLLKQAVILYVKANFGWNNPDAERLQRSYDLLKMSLSLNGDYNNGSAGVV